MTRLLDANLKFVGGEPRFSSDKPISKIDLIKAFSWYSQNKNTSDAQKYGHDYLKKNYKINGDDILKDYTPTFGFVCRIVSNGGKLLPENQDWFDKQINQIKVAIEQQQKKIVDTSVPIKPTIQDRMTDIIAEIGGELEGSIDDYILSKFKTLPSPFEIMKDKVKKPYISKLSQIFKRKKIEFELVYLSDDPQVKEGYSNFTKTQVKKLMSYCDLILSDLKRIDGEVTRTRKPRKPRAIKVKSPDQLVSKLVYMKEEPTLKIQSIHPQKILGATQLWVYNSKTRKLGMYYSSDSSGFKIKGSKIVDFDEVKSIEKKVRKPEILVPEIISGGKVFLRNALSNIKAVEYKLNGRITKDTILLRVI